MTDRELLGLAARAVNGGAWHPLTHEKPWNPLEDDGDALRLAVRLGINLEIGEPGFGDVQAGKKDHWACEWLNPDDPCASVRLAITRVAAEIGRAMG